MSRRSAWMLSIMLISIMYTACMKEIELPYTCAKEIEMLRRGQSGFVFELDVNSEGIEK